ncbi:porin [Herbaspirillum sp. GCM10030257]|uniref:porin n=1 Tax=Herbaspirillum sp. GCM10030257 TaxID=3273393 RepID=UPI00361276EB
MRLHQHTAAAAAALLTVSAHAQSSITLGGIVDGGAYQRKLAGETRINAVQGGLMSMSRIDIKGVEDLGGGNVAIFELSPHFRLDTGEAGRHPGDAAANRFFTRASWVGLRGKPGTLRIGRIPTGGYVQTLRFTPFEDSTFLGPFMMHTFVGSQPMLASRNSDGSWSNSIVYNSPSVAGFNTQLQYSLNEASGNGRRIEATMNYSNQKFAAAVSHGRITGAAYTVPRTRTDPAGTPYIAEQETSTIASVSYNFTVAKVYAQFASARLQPRGTTEISLQTLALNAEAPMGPGRIIAGWARTEREQAGTMDRTRSTATIGYDYILSKRTDWYTALIHDRATNLASGTGVATGIRHRF